MENELRIGPEIISTGLAGIFFLQNFFQGFLLTLSEYPEYIKSCNTCSDESFLSGINFFYKRKFFFLQSG